MLTISFRMAFDEPIRTPSVSSGEGDQTKLSDTFRQWTHKTCSRDFLHKRLPILTWILGYNLNTFIYDLVAGITCGLTVGELF